MIWTASNRFIVLTGTRYLLVLVSKLSTCQSRVAANFTATKLRISFIAALLITPVITTVGAEPNAQEQTPVQAIVLPDSPQWQKTLQQARGQTVYFHAWGGAKPINDYLRWAAKQIASKYRVRLRHVKVADISQAVKRLTLEDGESSAIDLLWINGENFSFLKQHGLLQKNLWSQIPNSALLATQQLPLDNDFGVPIEGYEVPWGVGQFNLIARPNVFNLGNQSTRSISPQQILATAKDNPGKLSYPRPPEFHGTTFLKQLLVALSGNDKRLHAPATIESQNELMPLLWHYLDQLHPLSWQQGKAFPSSSSEQFSLFEQQQLLMTVSFNPNQLFKEQQQQRLPSSTLRLHFQQGAITNSHNLAIPIGAQSSAGAKVVINFLLSELAQRHKLESSWGDPAVIAPLLDSSTTLPAQAELHSTWQQVIEQQWQQQYGV